MTEWNERVMDAQGDRVTVIGAGRMGSGIARRLSDAFNVTVWDASDAVRERVADGGLATADSLDVAVTGADVVLTSLPGPREVLAVYEAIARVEGGPVVCIDVSTVDVATALAVRDVLRDRRIGFVACPVGGGPAQAGVGELTLFPGGDDDDVERVMDVLTRLGRVTRLGTIQASVGFKLVCNMVGMTNVAILCEAFALGRRYGIDGETLGAALEAAGAGSHQLRIRWSAIASGDYATRFPVDLALKDLGLATREAASYGLQTLVADATTRSLRLAHDRGRGDLDVIAMAAHVDEERDPH